MGLWVTMRARLDRFISEKTGIKRKSVRLLLAQNRVTVDGFNARAINQLIHTFSHVMLDGQTLQAIHPVYIMLNKPQGVVSATSDTRHRTVIDCLNFEGREHLHIVGRLDFNSSGLLLLTNDGCWSRQLTEPANKVRKCYRVTLQQPLTKEYIKAFAEGMFFPYEGITTRPAKLVILSDYEAEVSLLEGRYHQIKRMFGRFQNKVVKLHRQSIGSICLDSRLSAGQYRWLSQDEVFASSPNRQ